MSPACPHACPQVLASVLHLLLRAGPGDLRAAADQLTTLAALVERR